MVHIFGKDRPADLKESNPYGISTTDANIKAPLASLEVLYERMPETSGCEKCEVHNGDNAYWCCKTINPSMYYVEFLEVWSKVQKWGPKKRLPVILRAIKTYLVIKIVRDVFSMMRVVKSMMKDRLPVECMELYQKKVGRKDLNHYKNNIKIVKCQKIFNENLHNAI